MDAVSSGICLYEVVSKTKDCAICQEGRAKHKTTMKSATSFRKSIPLLAVAALLGVAQSGFAEEKAAAKSEVVWKEIGTAPGAVGLAAQGKNLFAITSSAKLQVCDPSTSPVIWKEIGDAPGGVVAMGVQDGKLYASTNARTAGRFLSRDAVTTTASWQDLGHAWCLLGMAGVSGKMYAICDTKEPGAEASIMVRDSSAAASANAGRGLDGIPWNGVDRRPPVGALAITEVGGKFYVVTKEDALYVGDPTKPDVAWKAIGDAAGVTMLAGAEGKLYAATKTGKLLVCTVK